MALKKEQKFWHPLEAMLLLELKTISRTVNVILEGRFKVKNQLNFKFEHNCIQASLIIKHALLLMDHPNGGGLVLMESAS